MKLKLTDTKNLMDEEGKPVRTRPANPPKKVTAAAGGAPAATPPNGNVLILGDDGLFHVIDRNVWQAAPVVGTDDPGYPTLEILASNGVYLADLPDGVGGGIGEICTLVNLQAILDGPPGAGGGGAEGAGGGASPKKS